MKKCVCCGKEIEKDEVYFECAENGLVSRFEKNRWDNIFCTKDCFCEYFFLKKVYPKQ